MKKSTLILIIVLILAAAAGFFVCPKSPIAKWLPWRLGLDIVGGSHLIYEIDMQSVAEGDRDSVINGLRDVIEQRVNLFGVAEPQIIVSQSGDSYRLIVELAGIKDIKEAIRTIRSTPFLEFREFVEMPSDAALAPTGEEGNKIQFIPTSLTGRYVKSAQVGFHDVTSEPLIYIEFSSEGAKIFEELTSRLVGKPLAIFLDGAPIQVATVQEKISGGKAQITGKFTAQDARQFVERFNAGALPAPIELVSQQTVDALLGAESLKKILFAGLVALIVIILFMVIYYRRLGIIASATLLIYVILLLAVFKLISVTMSLATIAGFILSIGMAVDANILIFERMKEEMKKKLSKLEVIEEGFRRAWTSIRDANVTTILACVVLYYFTSSFIRGFALALMAGVLLSMFSAIMITKAMLKAVFKEKES